MQEEVENRTVNLAITTTKLSFRSLYAAYMKYRRYPLIGCRRYFSFVLKCAVLFAVKCAILYIAIIKFASTFYWRMRYGQNKDCFF